MAFINNTLITFITACFFTLALYLKFGLKGYYTYIILLGVILCVYFLNKYISEYKYKTNILKNGIPAIGHIDRCTRINGVDAYKLFIKYTCKNGEYHEFEEVILHSILNYSKAGSMSDILDKGGLMDLHYLLKSNKINVDIIYNKNDPSKGTLAKNFKIFFEKNDSSILDIKEKGKIILNNENINTNTNSQKIDFAYFDTKKIIKNSVISIIIMVISYTILFQYNIITDGIVNKCTTCFGIIILFMIPLILIFCALLLIFNYKLVKSLGRLLLLYLLKLFATQKTIKYYGTKITKYIGYLCLIIALISLFMILPSINEILVFSSEYVEYLETFKVNWLLYILTFIIIPTIFFTGLISVAESTKITDSLK